MKRKLTLSLFLLLGVLLLNAQSSWIAGMGTLLTSPSSTKVGIGVLSPTDMLTLGYGHFRMAGSLRPPFSSIDTRIKFGINESVQLGVWESDSTLSFKANKFCFNTGNVGIGISNPQYKLDVHGVIRADEIYVNVASGADFVFDESYKLRPLSEVKEYVEKKQHLPEIPSAKEMQQNGVNMNDLQMQLLQKVEELTLYILQQEQRIQQLENLLTK